MYRTLYLVRHGQTVFNTRGLIQGRCDSPLTELGREQGRAAADWLANHGTRIAAAFSSPAERACATAELLWAGPYARVQGLAERSFGELEGTPVSRLPKPMGDYPAEFGGETTDGLVHRLTEALRSIMRGGLPASAVAGRSDAPVSPGALGPAGDSDAVLAVSHGAACKAFAVAWSEGAQAEIPDPFPNCEILVYEFDGERFTLVDAVDPAGHLGGVGLSI